MSFPRFRGFTLIELLIVVAIIAILAAIAVPNFLEAQVRSKVSRTKNDMRTLATALEAYRLDYNKYPADGQTYNIFGEEPYRSIQPAPNPTYFGLSTPVAYVTSIPEDVFPDRSWGRRAGPYYFAYSSWYTKKLFLQILPNPATKRKETGKEWALCSYGPDRIASEGLSLLFGEEHMAYVEDQTRTNPNFNQFSAAIYDPTNGTMSNGDIVRLGP